MVTPTVLGDTHMNALETLILSLKNKDTQAYSTTVNQQDCKEYGSVIAGIMAGGRKGLFIHGRIDAPMV